jgi:hypothetical protein
MFGRSEASALQMSSEGHVKTVRYMNKTYTMIRSSSRTTKRCAVPSEASAQHWGGPRSAVSCRDCRQSSTRARMRLWSSLPLDARAGCGSGARSRPFRADA